MVRVERHHLAGPLGTALADRLFALDWVRRTDRRRLVRVMLTGDAEGALAALDEAHALGIDPTQLLRGLMESLHAATRAKAGAVAAALRSAEERESARVMAQKLGWGTIHRLWQMLLKGLQDVDVAPDPREAAEMALLRLIHSADLPDPAGLIAKLSGVEPSEGPRTAPASQSRSTIAQVPPDFRSLIIALEKSGRHQLALQLHDQIGLVRYAPPELALKPTRPLGGDWPRDLAAALKSATGAIWNVTLSDDFAEPSLLDQEKMAEERVRSDVLADPNVRAVMDAFPDAELKSHSTRDS